MVTTIKLFAKPGKGIPVVNDHVRGNFDDSAYREFVIVSIINARWTSRLLLEVTYKVRVTKHKSKLGRRKGLKIVE